MHWQVATVLALALMASGCGNSEGEAPEGEPTEQAAAPEPSSAGEEQGAYICPMRCKVEGEDAPYEQAEPGQCPVCGMNLEKKE